jgi:hypothetical protein
MNKALLLLLLLVSIVEGKVLGIFGRSSDKKKDVVQCRGKSSVRPEQQGNIC